MHVPYRTIHSLQTAAGQTRFYMAVFVKGSMTGTVPLARGLPPAAKGEAAVNPAPLPTVTAPLGDRGGRRAPVKPAAAAAAARSAASAVARRWEMRRRRWDMACPPSTEMSRPSPGPDVTREGVISLPTLAPSRGGGADCTVFAEERMLGSSMSVCTERREPLEATDPVSRVGRGVEAAAPSAEAAAVAVAAVVAGKKGASGVHCGLQNHGCVLI